MANWSQSHFLQSLGWATLNSFWQMALLWCLYLLLAQTLKLSARKRYELAVAFLLSGFGWAFFSFISFYNDPSMATLGFFDQAISDNGNLLQVCLMAASLAYLSLLAFPSYKLYKNWIFVRRIKREGLQKAHVQLRLYVQKISGHLGIGRKVSVYVSDLIRSPLTIGYLKPVILLPVAALNNLTTQQVEAVLLHELSHIRRFDYLVNFIISIIQTLLYFNPFVKAFMKEIESERETCCDELVLQFGYDKVGYASALLTLEKISVQKHGLALAATGKNFLLSRIERIVGLQKKRTLQGRQLAGVLATMFFIIAFNSILIIREKKENDLNLAAISNPFALFQPEGEEVFVKNSHQIPGLAPTQATSSRKAEMLMQPAFQPIAGISDEATQWEEPVEHAGLMTVANNEMEAALSEAEKAQVAEAVAATKKMVSSMQWKQIETQIGDVLTEVEKKEAEQEFQKEIEKINWENLEKNLKAQYSSVDWPTINANLNQAITDIKLDSIQKSFNEILVLLNKTEKEIISNQKISCTPIPDASLPEIRRAKEEIRIQLQQLKDRKAKIVKL